MKKRSISLALSLCLVLALLAGCGQKQKVETTSFTDSCGRVVDVPVNIERIVPSGSYAQIILYTLCPEKLISLSTGITRTQKPYFDETIQSLPVTGQFYGGGSTVNYEEIISLAPDIILDIGEAKENIAKDMDQLQEKTGIPVIFIEANLNTMAEAYDTLGALLGVEEQGSACATYIRDVFSDVAEKTAQLQEGERKRVLYAQGEYGTEVLGQGSIHAEVLEYAGAVNVAVLPDVVSKGGNEVSMEQILQWDPEVVILAPDANYDEIFDDPLWAGVQAVQNGAVYEAPNGPYNWMDQPPSVQRVLAIQWLANLLYPARFDYDMVKQAQEFYSLFWHYDLSQKEAEMLLQNSTFVTEGERGA